MSPLTLLYPTDIVVGAVEAVAVAGTGGADAEGAAPLTFAPPVQPPAMTAATTKNATDRFCIA
ncbi:MAG TPA: hypothetical protein VIN69_11980 [Candidatus Limnocylindria bacterium]